MSKKISKQKEKLKINLDENCNCKLPTKYHKAHISFNYKYIVHDKRYNLQNDKADYTFYKELHKLIEQLSKSNILELATRNKYAIGGFEQLDLCDLKISVSIEVQNDLRITPNNTKVYVFRFGPKDAYRMVCYQSKQCNAIVFYILAFDFDFNLYNHGK